MRTYGRQYPRNQDGTRQTNSSGKPLPGKWVEVSTDADGNDDQVWLTTLAQVLQLQLQESPFYSDWGLPLQQTIVQQLFPDFYMGVIQQRFAQYFASLIITKEDSPTPTYRVDVTTMSGQRLTAQIAV